MSIISSLSHYIRTDLDASEDVSISLRILPILILR